MKRFLIPILVLLISSTFIFGCSKKSSSGSLVKLNNKDKFVVLIFDSTTCPYCKRLHEDLRTNPKLISYEKKMTIYTIHVDESNSYILPTPKGKLKLQTEDIARMYGFRGSTPYIVFCNKNFKPIVTIPGYLRPKTLSKVFEYILSRAYKTMSISEYLSTP